MQYSIEDLVRQIRLVMDENTDESALLSDATNLDLNRMIAARLPEGARLVHERAPTRLIDGRPMNCTPVHRQDGSGYVELPDDFMRLVIFRLDGWKRPVTRPIEDTSPEYALQKNKYVRGNSDKPVCVLSTDGSGNKILEYYSLPASVADPVVTHAAYVPYPEVSDGKIEISRRLTDAVIYMTAGLTFQAMGETGRAKEYMELSTLFIDGDIDRQS